MEIGGLPVHILLIHGVVVLLPLLGLTALVYALWRRSRAVLPWPLLVGVFVVGPMTLLAKEFGEKLAEALPSNPAIEAHAEWGDLTAAMCGLFCVALLAYLAVSWPAVPGWPGLGWVSRLQQSRPLLVAAQALTILLAVAAIIVTVLAGHSGAFAVWGGWHR